MDAPSNRSSRNPSTGGVRDAFGKSDRYSVTPTNASTGGRQRRTLRRSTRAPARYSSRRSVSMPGVTEEIERSRAVHLAYRDLDGRECFEEAEGLRAVCHQHEIDQLDGVFWIQRLSPLKRERLVKKYQKLARRS